MNLDTEQFVMTLLRSMSEAVVYADEEGRIQYWNAGAERIFDYAASDALGQALDIIIPRSLRGRHWEGYRRTMQTGTTRYCAGDLLAVPATRRDGSRIPIEFTVTPFHDLSGKILGIAAIIRDASTRFEEMKALRQRAAAASG